MQEAIGEDRAHADGDREDRDDEIGNGFVGGEVRLHIERNLGQEDHAQKPEPGDAEYRLEDVGALPGMAKDPEGLGKEVAVDREIGLRRGSRRNPPAGHVG